MPVTNSTKNGKITHKIGHSKKHKMKRKWDLGHGTEKRIVCDLVVAGEEDALGLQTDCGALGGTDEHSVVQPQRLHRVLVGRVVRRRKHNCVTPMLVSVNISHQGLISADGGQCHHQGVTSSGVTSSRVTIFQRGDGCNDACV